MRSDCWESLIELKFCVSLDTEICHFRHVLSSQLRRTSTEETKTETRTADIHQ